MSDESNFPPQTRPRPWSNWAVLAVVLTALLVVLYWLRRPPVDWQAVHAQNNRAIAVMEGYHYEQAVSEFEKVVRLAPDWLPGRINLGIALLNASSSRAELAQRCKAVFEEVLRRDADNTHAHFCLGILLRDHKDRAEAAKHFQAVLKKDPGDAYSWFWLGRLKEDGSDEQSQCYRKALERDRHLSGAIYSLFLNLRRKDPKAAQAFLDEHEALKRANWQNVADIKYSQMGPLAEVIGRDSDRRDAGSTVTAAVGPLPRFEKRQSLQVRLAANTRWAKATDLDELRKLARARFGAAMVILDYNRDGRSDLFLIGAVVEKGRVRDLLLRNDGEGVYTDATAEAGLAEPRSTLGCCVADCDNDGHPDLLLSGAGVQKLFRNNGKGRFEDATGKAELDKLTSVCLGAAFFDIDQDGDLDILLCEYAATVEDAVAFLKGEAKHPKGGSLAVYLHTGIAPPAAAPDRPTPPLECKFKKTSLPKLQEPVSPLVGLAASDVDGDRDLDFLLLGENAGPTAIINNRLLNFSRKTNIADAAKWNGALVLDVDHDGRSDFLLLADDERPLLLNNRSRPDPGMTLQFERRTTNSPPLRQAVAVDVDLDSWMDVVGLSRDGVPILLHNEGGRLTVRPEALGRDGDWPRHLLALNVCADDDGRPYLLLWSEEQGLQRYDNRGNGNNGVLVELAGRNSKDGQNELRCNADGIGARAAAYAGTLWSMQENTTLSAGLAQSRQPLLFGVGLQQRIEVLRIRWPDGTLQAEPDINNKALTLDNGGPHRILQRNRMPGSCPILFAWNGRRFAFVNDFLGAGNLGETAVDGSCRLPRSEESLKIEAEQLATRDGQYLLKITEPMDETTYLDYLRLDVVDSPPDVRVYPDERFVTTGPPASQKLIAFAKEIFPVRVRDHCGRDATEKLRRWDGVFADFTPRGWIGFADDHAVELDFGDRIAAFGPSDRLYLCVAGWTAYPFPESIWAANQAGVAVQWPILERQDESGRWRSLGECGFPAGLPRMTLLDVSGKLIGRNCRLRLRTNMRVYWDQIFVAADVREPHSFGLDVHEATLRPGRIVREYSPSERGAVAYDFDRHEDIPVVRQSGQATRFGDVTDLLRRRDDRFVIFGPGDDLTVRFDAASLPKLPAGWQRSFVLRTAGYCKDNALSTAHGNTVEPLPFRAMRNYPYTSDQHYPFDAGHRDYLRRFLHREIEANPSP